MREEPVKALCTYGWLVRGNISLPKVLVYWSVILEERAILTIVKNGVGGNVKSTINQPGETLNEPPLPEMG